ncbi:helix-turn-helix domain-containing protein [bacterium]|nr:helix-turn-helix domain-containing protein [bacterium]
MKVKEPNVYTTGKIAKLCAVSIRTVARWIESDQLKAYRLPGESTEYRVSKADLLAFLKEFGLPWEHVEGDKTVQALLLDSSASNVKAVETSLSHLEAKTNVAVAQDIISGAILLGLLQPQLLVIDLEEFDNAEISRMLELARTKEQLKETKIIILADGSASDKTLAKFEKLGVEVILKKPVTTQSLSKKVSSLF